MAPKNISTAHSTRHRLVFPFLPFLGENEKADDMILFCSEVSMPGLSMEVEEIPEQFYDRKMPTKNLRYGDLTVTYTIDEKFDNYKLLFNWLMYLKSPESFGVNKEQIDVSLFIYSNNDNPLFSFTLKNIFPFELTGIEFNKKNNTADVMEGTVSFAMEYYLINTED